ncbi:glutathione S-transferase family protein [Hoeflea prorocentri]|uniref:Glutathione S-transferase n=1 Tax=Hoeflea prorocentri TaxID=1922333 RepID=A0A9X3UGH2_9HYPH|nr:glutathione S-transferase [Hoeflea prorocentri]MCY6380913.1 glutathione S-transferase [Hoeflea prorocentri]MDA5398713.1 glutathione S-transferase [Hoeflea prorocentri]
MKMYGAEVSYFSGKLRSYLDWKGLDYEEVPATRDVYVHKILPNIGWLVIPVVELSDGTFLQDTTEIIRRFEAAHPSPPAIPGGPRRTLASLLLELYADEWLVLAAMHYRWNYNRDFAISEFGALSAPAMPAGEQLAIGERIAKPFAEALPALGISEATIPAIEQSYLGLLRELERHFSVHDYVLGAAPTLGDFALFGPLYAHLYRDPASGELMRQRAPAVVRWVERVRSAKDRGTHISSDEDALPATILPVLRRACSEHLPVLLDTVREIEKHAATHRERELPRAIGFHAFTLAEATGRRAVFPYTQWMLQNLCDRLQSYSGDDEQSALTFLSEIGGGDLSSLRIKSRVRRENFQLILDR